MIMSGQKFNDSTLKLETRMRACALWMASSVPSEEICGQIGAEIQKMKNNGESEAAIARLILKNYRRNIADIVSFNDNFV